MSFTMTTRFGRLAAAWALSLLLMPPHSADAQVEQLHLFVRGGDNAPYQSFWDGSQWNGWFRFDGAITASPTVASYNGQLHLFVRGADNALYQLYWDGSQWNGWFRLGGSLNSAPTVVSYNGQLHVFAVGADNALYQLYWDGSQWNGWFRFDSFIVGQPAAVSYNGQLHLFVTGGDNALYQLYWDGGQWNGWFRFDGSLAFGPGAASYAGQLHVFVVGGDNALYQLYWDGGQWNGWFRFDGFINETPAVTGYGSFLVVFVRGGDDGIYELIYSGIQNQWLGWSKFSGFTISGPGATSHLPGGGTPGPNRPPTVNRLVATWNQLSDGRAIEVRGPGIDTVNGVFQFLGLPGPGQPGPGLPQVITIDGDGNGLPDPTNPFVMNARGGVRGGNPAFPGLPSSIVLVVAEGASDLDGDPVTFNWEFAQTQNVTYYSTGSAGSAFPAGAKITDLSQYNRNSILVEAPDLGWPLQDSDIHIGGLFDVCANVSDAFHPVDDALKRCHAIEYDREIQMNLRDVRGVELDLFSVPPGGSRVYGQDGIVDTIALELLVELTIAREPPPDMPNFFEPLPNTWFRVMCGDPSLPIGDDGIVDLGPGDQELTHPNSKVIAEVPGEPMRPNGGARIRCFYPLINEAGLNTFNRGKSADIRAVAGSLGIGVGSPPGTVAGWPFVVEVDPPPVHPPLGDFIPTIDVRGASLADRVSVKIEPFESNIQLISVFDSGSVADDRFELLINDVSQGTTPKGGELVFGPNFTGGGSLTSGTHKLCIRVVEAPDDIGTYTVRLLGGGMRFAGGETEQSGAPPQGTVDCFTFTVP
jgi:hypothetical protein